MAHITLLQINDLHGYLEPHPELFELTSGAPWRSGVGIARIASVFGAVRRDTGVSAVDALRQYVMSRDVVASDIGGSVTLV